MKGLYKRLIILAVTLIIAITGVSLYYTYATGESQQNPTYTFNLTGTTTVTVEANSSKTVIYQIENTNPGRVRYGVGYSTENNDVTVKFVSSSEDMLTGLIDGNAIKSITLKIINNSNESADIELSAILGYENGGALIVPSGVTQVTDMIIYGNAAKTITNLYLYNKDVIDNDDQYQTSSTVGLMNDRLGGTTSSYDGGNVRYYGADPDNYIYFNCTDYSNQSSSTCEKWRIIGVFDGKLKIIRDSIGNYSWDTSASDVNSGYGINEWTQADLMKLLNPEYEYNKDTIKLGGGSSTSIELVNNSLYWNSGSGYCYSNTNNAAKTCNFSSTGLKNNDTKNRIAESTWYLGAFSSAAVTPSEAYALERGNTHVQNPDDGITREDTWTGRIALMYPSDYGYAVDFTSCQNKLLSAYDTDDCKKNNWLYTSSNMWTLTSQSGAVYVGFIVRGNLVGVNLFVAYGFYAIRPTLFLTSGQIIVGGTGESDSPYRLG